MKTLLEVSHFTNLMNPVLLHTNVVRTVFQFTTNLKHNLELEGYKVSFVGKTKGEGQFTPPGWKDVVVNGFLLTGVSHDALWVNGKQYDFVGQGNDSDEEIYYSDGRHMEASPVANEIPPQNWRANNPPVDLSGTQTFDPPQLPKVVVKPYPGDPVGTALANQLFSDYAVKGELPNPGMGVWIFRVAWQVANEGKTVEEAVEIQRNGTGGWKAALGI